MDDNTLSLVITCVAAVAFVTSAWATFWVWRGRRGGWARVAAAYPAAVRPAAAPRRYQSVVLMPSGVGYPALVTLRLGVEGLYAVPGWPVRTGHDAVLVPWDDIEILAVDTYPADRLYDLKFARVPQVRMRVGVGVAQFVRRAADNSRYFADAAGDDPAPRPAPKPRRRRSVA